MRAPLRICRARGVAVVLALGAAISLTGETVPALAQPICTTAIEGGYGCEPETPATEPPETPATAAGDPDGAAETPDGAAGDARDGAAGDARDDCGIGVTGH